MVFILSYQADMRAGEIASVTVRDVFEADSKTVRSQIRLSSENIKGRYAGTVFVSARLRREIGNYRTTQGDSVKLEPPNTLCQLMGADVRAGRSRRSHQPFGATLVHRKRPAIAALPPTQAVAAGCARSARMSPFNRT